MGMPDISISFTKRAVTSLSRSSKGVLCMLLSDANVGGIFTYTGYKYVKESFNADNLALIKQAFDDGLHKLIVVSVDETTPILGATAGTGTVGAKAVTTTKEILDLVKMQRFNYLVSPYSDVDDFTLISTWVKDARANGKKVKAVLPSFLGDHEGIINFASTGLEVNKNSMTQAKFTVRVAVALATCPLNQSRTYFVFKDVTAVDDVPSKDTAIDAGKLIMLFDGVKYKLARAVNSLTTLGTDKKDSMKKIKIIEGMDLIYEDIHEVFEDDFIGKVTATYANKLQLVGEINEYFRLLENEGVLNPDQVNEVYLDIEATENYIKNTLKVDTSAMSETDILKYDVGEKVFIGGNIYLLDAMEDLSLNLYF